MAADWIEWEGLGKAEFDAHQALNPEFEAYESSVAGKYNVVDRVLGLSVSRQALDTMVIGACLVRALNDLRSVW